MPKIIIDKSLQTSLSKSKNPRSQFLSALGKLNSGDLGNALAEAFVKGDADAFGKHFDKLKGSLQTQIRRKGH